MSTLTSILYRHKNRRYKISNYMITSEKIVLAKNKIFKNFYQIIDFTVYK